MSFADDLRESAERRDRDRVEAARYRWLRDKSEPNICAFYLSVGMGLHGVRFVPATVDAAIDAAMAKEQPDRTAGVTEEQVSPALARQRRLVATLPQTAEQVARLTPCAALGKGAGPVHCGHCGKTVTPGGECSYGVGEVPHG